MLRVTIFKQCTVTNNPTRSLVAANIKQANEQFVPVIELLPTFLTVLCHGVLNRECLYMVSVPLLALTASTGAWGPVYETDG